MLSRRQILVTAILCLAAPAIAAEVSPYSEDAFNKAQQAGRSILVKVHAPWCATCKAQTPVVDALLAADDAFGKFVVFKVDFDTQKDALKRFNAEMQSTLIAYKGKREMSRSVGDVRLESIAVLLRKAL